jgi:hypothetical protein
MYIFARFSMDNMSIFAGRLLRMRSVLVYYFYKYLNKSTFYYHILCRSNRRLRRTQAIPFIPLLFFRQMV